MKDLADSLTEIVCIVAFALLMYFAFQLDAQKRDRCLQLAKSSQEAQTCR